MSASEGGAGRRWRRVCYRASQVLLALQPTISPGEAAEVRRRLREPELRLFLAADARDRRHSVDLFKSLLREGTRRGRYPSDALLVAALLHDVGKGRVRTWHRVLFVMLEAAMPRVARRVEAEHGLSWQRALWRLRHHAALGAALLREVGSQERVIDVVARHTDLPPDTDEELAWFIEVDDRS